MLSVALAVKNGDAPAEDKKAFLEELIIRRELGSILSDTMQPMTGSMLAKRGPIERCASILLTDESRSTAKPNSSSTARILDMIAQHQLLWA